MKLVGEVGSGLPEPSSYLELEFSSLYSIVFPEGCTAPAQKFYCWGRPLAGVSAPSENWTTSLSVQGSEVVASIDSQSDSPPRVTDCETSKSLNNWQSSPS